LKGSSKAQGNWGERVLESLLELAGLQRDLQYVVQESHQREDGSRAQPDVVVNMPEGRHLVVDAKVSLTAYEEYASAEDEVTREAALRRHLDSVRAHVRGLHERDYQALHGVGSYDFVLMFVAVEPAFMLAVTQDRELFQYAWSRNVLLVSPSTLLFVLRTVAQLWRQDAQNRNALEISKRGAELYDKLALFIESLEAVGARLAQAQAELDTARTRLTGKGGALRQAEMLRKLGVKPKKSLPPAVAALVSEATEGEEESEAVVAAEAAAPAVAAAADEKPFGGEADAETEK
jgi:DNA recombination protein RmuC